MFDGFLWQGVDGVHENHSHEGGVAGRVGRYSAEERKERIERYKSKRNQRNFHKKITVSTDPVLLHQLSFFDGVIIPTLLI